MAKKVEVEEQKRKPWLHDASLPAIVAYIGGLPYTAAQLERYCARVPHKAAIVGSRQYPRQQDVIDAVNALPAGSTVISGGAKGVDTWAAEAARARGLDVVEFRVNGYYPDKRAFRAAAMARNTQIVDAGDRVIAFWDGESAGTADSIRKAQAAGKPVAIVRAA
jgi:hypothetical protein